MKTLPGLKNKNNIFEINTMMRRLGISRSEMNESMEILHYKYDTKKTKIFSKDKIHLFTDY